MIRHRNAKWHYTTTTIAVILSYIVLQCSLSGNAFHPASTSSWRPIQTASVSSKLKSCKYIKMHCSTNKGIDYLDEEDEEDDENELTDDEKKSLAKAYFDNTLNLNENSVRPTDVYIILFNPNTSSEGAHTVKFCGKDYMLGFESRPECISFSNQLEESGFYQPVVSNTTISYYVLLFIKYLFTTAFTLFTDGKMYSQRK